MGDDIMKVRSIANPDFQVSKLERETLHDRAYLELKKAIMSGAIRPGATITIRAMATALGTSPMPVREALRRLVAERALEMLPTRSVTLPLMTAERFDEISRLRIALEGLATEAGAQHLSREALRRLQQGNTEMNRMKNVGEYLAKNQEFHFTLYQAAGMPIALQMIESLWLQAGPLLNLAIGEYGFEGAQDHHRELLEQLAKHNVKGARGAIEADITDAARIIRAYLASRPEAAAAG
ncbi:MAG TPA: GntR family transcriptional regulator [Dongiaceae bacterium]